jgi:hypothetical protein
VCGGEELSLFCRKRHLYRENKDPAKWVLRGTAFEPRRRPSDQRLEASICQTTGVPIDELWAICVQHFDAHQQSPALGRGIGLGQVVLDEGLTFEVNGDPHPCHANILGWPEDPSHDDEKVRHLWMKAALNMAAKFKYEPRPDPAAAPAVPAGPAAP